MKKLYSLLLFLLVGFFSFSQQTINTSITHDGGQRDYILYVPASYDGNTDVPLLLVFHGYTSNNNNIMTYSEFNNVADTAGCIVAYPQGTLFNGNTHWNVGGWTVGSTTDDVGFVDALLDSIEADYSIDTDRVYSTGMSNGGYMSFLLACQLSDRIAAVASVTGSMTPQTYSTCNPQHPTPVLQIHGDSDGTVPYNGDIWTESIPDVLSYWSNYNNNGMADTFTVANTITWDGSNADRIQYDYGDNCVLVEHYKVYGGDHDWCGAWGNMDFSATEVVWNFLRQFDINGIDGCVASTEDIETEMSVSFYPNPVSDVLQIENPSNQQSSYQIVDMTGRIVGSGMVNPGHNDINLSFLQANQYIIQIDDEYFQLVKI